jgi:transposase-like protein
LVLWGQYAHDYCTINQLARKYHKSEKWVRTQLDVYGFPEHIPQSRPVVIVADAMFFGRHWGMVVMRDPHRKENLYWEEIMTESPSVYQAGISFLRQRGFTIHALVIDGRKGVKEAFSDIPIQMCQFHQIRIVTRYLTTRPKLEAGQELRVITLMLSESTKEKFTMLLCAWHRRWSEFLKEKTVNPETKRRQYTHRRLRSAYFSLRRNLPQLFTYERYPAWDIPKTTNGLEGVFSHIKTAMRIHRGLRQKRKRKLIDFLLRN